MSTQSTDKKVKKKSKFKFKNGLKNLKNKVKKNDTFQHFTGTPKQNSITPTDNNHSSNGTKKSKKNINILKKKKKAEKPRLPKLQLSEYTYPNTILPPDESWGAQQYDQEDRILHEYMNTKYQNEIYKLKFFPEDILIRFTLSQRGMKPFSLRKQETETHFKAYLKYHYKNHYDDILSNDKLNCNKSLSNIKNDSRAIPLFIYGMDKQGHPIFWDDGSQYSKGADLTVFKNDMKRVGMFRARVMKRMHNIKLATSQKYQQMIYKHCLVMDLDNFNAKQFMKDRKFHEMNTKDTSDLFPEVLHKLYIINAPWAFRSAWKIIQTFLHPITVEKTKILGKDYMPVLLKDIDIAMIPYKWGGIGPWESVYGSSPLLYPLQSCDSELSYKTLPKQSKPMPPRTPIPDMNKHKKRMEKQMRESGMSNPMEQYKANNAQFCIDEDGYEDGYVEDEEKGNEFDVFDVCDGNDENVGMLGQSKSAPIPMKDEQQDLEDRIGDQKDEEGLP